MSIPEYILANPTLLAEYRKNGRYRELVDGGVGPSKSISKCIFLGEQIGERDCKSCGDRTVKLKVYSCSHPEHTDTTIVECNKCPHFASSN